MEAAEEVEEMGAVEEVGVVVLELEVAYRSPKEADAVAEAVAVEGVGEEEEE